MTSTFRPAVDAAGEEPGEALLALMDAAYDRVMNDLERALEICRQRDGATDG